MTNEEQHIIHNLFDFWEFTGIHTNTLHTEPDLKAIILQDSDWPKRVFDLGPSPVFPQIAARITAGELPNNVTLTETINQPLAAAIADAGFQPRLQQLGMIIDLTKTHLPENDQVIFTLVSNADDAALYADIASRAFNYRISPHMLAGIMNKENRAKLFIGKLDGAPACCGLVFYDKFGCAGLHLIGTLSEFRGKGLASAITVQLMKTCKEDGITTCVLHASAAGEKVYLKLGFQPEKRVYTYSLVQ